MICGTIFAESARDVLWDVIVIGGGPAGSVAALGTARRGLRTLLVDRSEFPRHKLCGACLNKDAIAGLKELGLADPFAELGGVALSEFQLRSQGRSLTLRLPAGIAVTRRQFDAMLIESAIAAGCEFLPGTSLNIEPAEPAAAWRQLTTNGHPDEAPLRARCVVMATGLSAERRSGDPALAAVAERGSRIGAGTTTQRFPDHYHPGTIYMAVGKFGYVGLTRTEGRTLNIAAALDQKAAKQNSPRGLCEKILQQAGFAVSEGMLDGEWRGTGSLTRHRRVPAAARLLAVGDAAGYVEPFTGEGMAWAIRGAQAAVPFVEEAVREWHPDMIAAWTRTSRERFGRRQRWCRILTQLLRYPLAVRGLVQMMSVMPALGQAVVSQLNQEHDNNEVLDRRAGHSRAS